MYHMAFVIAAFVVAVPTVVLFAALKAGARDPWSN